MGQDTKWIDKNLYNMGQVYVRKVGEIYERKNIYTIKIYIIKKRKCSL